MRSQAELDDELRHLRACVHELERHYVVQQRGVCTPLQFGLGRLRVRSELDTTANCGICGNTCPTTCTSGRCLVALASGQSSPSGVAVDGSSVYWTDVDSNAVMKVNLGGGTPVTLASGQNSPEQIAVDSTSVYWTNLNGGTVMKVDLGGGTPATLASAQNFPVGIAVDSTSVYWTTGSTVMELGLGGGTPVPLASGQNKPYSVAVDSTSVYWTDRYSGKVMRLTPR